jgi:hypothetical protein
MSSPRECLRRADDAKERAVRASEPFYKSAYEKTAECWTVLARIDSFLHDEHKSLHGDIGRAPVGLYAALTGRSSQANVCRALARRILIAIEAKHKKSNS